MTARRIAMLTAWFPFFLLPISALAQPATTGAKPQMKQLKNATSPSHAAPTHATANAGATTGSTNPTPAQISAAAAVPLKLDLKLNIIRKTLPNGLRIVLAPDATAPTIAVDVVYDVGSRVEERGHSGFAHLFEHMMFQGSANVPKGGHFLFITSHGGQMNGTTNQDRTNYFEMLPRSELPLALWLEADRLKSLDVSEANFENQRSVVKEEYRMRVENAAYVPAELRAQELVFQGYFPYEHATIGSMRDLDAAQIDWVRKFHDTYYAVNNAILSVAGDFNPDEAMPLIEKYFGNAKPSTIPKFDVGTVPPQTAPRDEVVEDAHAKLPAFFDGWVIPENRSPEHYALALAGMILTDGESSRLYRSLVRERAVAVSVEAGTNDYRGPDWFEIEAKLASGAKIADVEKQVETAIATLGAKGPTDAELTKAKTRFMSHYVMGLQSNFARAQKLAEFEVYWGDANLLNQEAARYLAVSNDDIKKAVSKFLTKERRSRVEVRPAADAAAPAKATTKTATKTNVQTNVTHPLPDTPGSRAPTVTTPPPAKPAQGAVKK